MSRTFHHGKRRIRVEGIRKDPPDLRRLARALIELAQLEAEAEAEAQHKLQESKERPGRGQTDKRDRTADDEDPA
jgi:hypothetical protein